MTCKINADTSDGLKIVSDTSGEVVIQTNGTTVATASSTGITMASGKKVFSTGTILQVVSTTKTDVFSSSTVDTFVDITGLSVAITPSATSSKILVLYDTQMSGTELFFIQLVRASTAIKVGDSDSANRIECTAGGIVQSSNNDKVQNIAGTFLDSPSTTGATTYKLQGRVYSASKTFKINAPVNDSNASYSGRGASTITVMEVAG